MRLSSFLKLKVKEGHLGGKLGPPPSILGGLIVTWMPYYINKWRAAFLALIIRNHHANFGDNCTNGWGGSVTRAKSQKNTASLPAGGIICDRWLKFGFECLLLLSPLYTTKYRCSPMYWKARILDTNLHKNTIKSHIKQPKTQILSCGYRIVLAPNLLLYIDMMCQ